MIHSCWSRGHVAQIRFFGILMFNFNNLLKWIKLILIISDGNLSDVSYQTESTETSESTKKMKKSFRNKNCLYCQKRLDSIPIRSHTKISSRNLLLLDKLNGITDFRKNQQEGINQDRICRSCIISAQVNNVSRRA